VTTLPSGFCTYPYELPSQEIADDGFKVFAFTSLLPKDDYTVHLAKMAFRETRYCPTRPGQPVL